MKKGLPAAAFALLFVAGLALLAFPPRDWMQRAVQDFGFRDVHLTGFAWLGCSGQDSFRQTWVGRSVAGRSVGGVVCGGPVRAWTVRLT